MNGELAARVLNNLRLISLSTGTAQGLHRSALAPDLMVCGSLRNPSLAGPDTR